MSMNSRRRKLVKDTGQTAIAGVAGTTFAGSALDTSQVEPGSLMARCVATIATSSLTLAPKWQVSDDATTWEDVVSMNNAAPVAITATATIHLVAPHCLSGKKWVRAAFLSAGATAAAGDFKRFSYSYLSPNF